MKEVLDNIPQGTIIDRYIDTMKNILLKALPELEEFELDEAIRYSIGVRYKSVPVKVHHNVKNIYANMDVLALTNQLLKQEAVMTTQGVLFRPFGSVKNPFYNYIQYLLDKREEAKEEMKHHDKGTELYNRYNLMQLNYKVACNALYGCAGQWSSIFYNLYLCTAVTGQGRGCISASITMFEGFLSDNMKFASLTEVLTYIDNICRDIKESRKFNDYQVLDKDITTDECFLRIFRLCGYNSWVPNDDAVQVIWDTINNLDQRELNMVYYKNNLYKFCDNIRVRNLIMKILLDLEEPFLNPYEPPKNIRKDLKMLLDLMREYVYYRHLYIDKIERVYNMIRHITLLTDTDSCVVSLDTWYRYVLEMTIGIPMKIKYTKTEMIKAADRVIYEFQKTDMIDEYNFYNQDLVQRKRLSYPAVIIEEDNLRFSIINIMSYIVGDLILDYMDLFSHNYNSYSPDRKQILIMKNEFLFKSIFLTPGKKNYSSLQLLQEGHIIPEDKQFDIKGMPISKIGIPKSTSEQLSNLLEYDILRRSFVDQVELIRKFATLEKIIYNSIKSKNREYHKPARIKSSSSYDQPMRIQGVKAAFAYNSIRDPQNEEGVNLEERNTVLIIKTVINTKNCDMIAENFPSHFIRLKKLLNTKEFSGVITAIAIPINIKIPDWVVPFIDYTTIIHDNLRNFPLDDLGISKIDNKDITHTNIVKF